MPPVKRTAVPSTRRRWFAIRSGSHRTYCTLAERRNRHHALAHRRFEAWKKSLAKGVWENNFRADFMDPRGRLRIARHRPFHLVSKRTARPVRGEFSEAGKLRIKSRREGTDIALGRQRWTAVSLELACRVSTRAKFS